MPIDKCKPCAWLAEQCMNGAGCMKCFWCIVVGNVYMIHSPKGAKSQQGKAHVALLSSLGYNNESNCVFALVHIMWLLLPLFLARSVLEQVVLCTQSSNQSQTKTQTKTQKLILEPDKNI